MDEVVIKVESISKEFRLPHDKASSIKGNLINVLRHKHGYDIQKALDNISFEVKKGEFFGIVGKNGGGKSTLLKLISGIYTPTKGNIHIRGKLTPFIELGVGFNPELTGRDNIFLNGALLGFNRSEMSSMYKDIVKFAELEKFMDQKLKNYSSGMQVRLAFSIAIRAESDILVMDEVLAVGDAAFQKKCFDIFRQLKKEGRTILLVTHDMANVEKFCDRVLVIDQGKQISVTTAAEASLIYAHLNVDHHSFASRDEEALKSNVRRGSGEVRVIKHTLLSGNKVTSEFKTGEEFTLKLDIERKKIYKNKKVIYGLSFHNADELIISGPNSQRYSLNSSANQIYFTVPRLPLAPGDYILTIALYSDDMEALDIMEKWVNFTIISDHSVNGFVEFDGSWETK